MSRWENETEPIHLPNLDLKLDPLYLPALTDFKTGSLGLGLGLGLGVRVRVWVSVRVRLGLGVRVRVRV